MFDYTAAISFIYFLYKFTITYSKCFKTTQSFPYKITITYIKRFKTTQLLPVVE